MVARERKALNGLNFMTGSDGQCIVLEYLSLNSIVAAHADQHFARGSRTSTPYIGPIPCCRRWVDPRRELKKRGRKEEKKGIELFCSPYLVAVSFHLRRAARGTVYQFVEVQFSQPTTQAVLLSASDVEKRGNFQKIPTRQHTTYLSAAPTARADCRADRITNMGIRTIATELLGIEHPIVCGGMTATGSAELAAAGKLFGGTTFTCSVHLSSRERVMVD